MPAKKSDIIVCAHEHPFCSGSPWSLGIEFCLSERMATLNLNKKEMDTIFQEVQESVSKWEELAKNTGIPSVQRRLMEAAFHLK